MKAFGILVFSIFLFISCSKEKKVVNTIEGKWKISQLEYKTAVPDTATGQSFNITGNVKDAGFIEFRKEGMKGIYDINFFTDPLNIKLPNFPNPIIVPSTNVILNGNGTYTNTSDEITITDTAGIRKFSILTLGKKNTILSTSEPYYVDSLKLNVVINLTLNLEKVN